MKSNTNYYSSCTKLPSGTTHYIETAGTGVPVHFLHANSMCAEIYIPFFKFLETEFKITASDIRGHGQSSEYAYGKITDWRPFSKDLNDFLISKMNPPVTGAGHSMGATITMLAAASYPESFTSIILIDPVFLSIPEIIKRKLLRFAGKEGILALPSGARSRRNRFKNIEEASAWFNRKRGLFSTWDNDFIRSFIEHAFLSRDDSSIRLKCSPETEAQMYEADSLNIWKFVKKIKCPVLLIRGEKSFVFSETMFEKFKKLVPDAQTVTIKDAGHFIPMEKPKELSSIIRNFIKTQSNL